MPFAVRSDNIITFTDSGKLEVINGYVITEGGIITEVSEGSLPERYQCTDGLCAVGKTVSPGFIDAHTHLIHAGSRENELSMKLAGVSYLDILKGGGGILSTVAKTRAASAGELKAKAKKSLDIMLSHGTTTVEAKSGYGLDFETEIKCLEAARELGAEHPVDIISTYMGAHAVPPEFKSDREAYINMMTEQVMPYIAENKLADYVDAFCEEGVFSVEETRRILNAAKKLGFGIKIHADEIEPMGGGELSAELSAVSAEHLLEVSDEGIRRMAEAGVCAVLLPGTSFYLMTGKFARARDMLDRGMTVALATDYNPGSCPTENLQAIIPFAAFGMKLTPEEIIRGMTLNAAKAVGRKDRIGNIRKGMAADLVIFDAPNPDYIVYHFGINHAETVIKNGKIVWKREGSFKQC